MGREHYSKQPQPCDTSGFLPERGLLGHCWPKTGITERVEAANDTQKSSLACEIMDRVKEDVESRYA